MTATPSPFPTDVFVLATKTLALTMELVGACLLPSRASTWFHVTSGAVTVTPLVDKAVIGIFAAFISALLAQASYPHARRTLRHLNR